MLVRVGETRLDSIRGIYMRWIFELCYHFSLIRWSDEDTCTCGFFGNCTGHDGLTFTYLYY